MENYATDIFEKLMQHYGVSEYFDTYPELEFDYDSDGLLYGEFRDDYNGIVLYMASFKDANVDVKEAIATTINHEIIHYHQCPSRMKKYQRDYEYWTNPFEKEAFQREEEWKKILE